MATDQDWAEAARAARQALITMGYPVKAGCHPDEDEPCSGNFAQHAAAYYVTLHAVTDHQLEHLGPCFDQPELIYDDAMRRLRRDCQLERPRP
jgi:hypothetical protein